MSERRPIPGYGDLYEADADGRIWSLPRLVRCRGGHRSVGERQMKPWKIPGGYLQVQLSVGGKHVHKLVHRLVCAAFHGAPDAEDLQVNHKNGARDDNRAENLEWVTCSENAVHSFRALGRKRPHPMLGRFGGQHNRARAVESFELASGQTVALYGSAMCAQRAGFNCSAVIACVNGRRKSHKGLGWRESRDA